MQKQYAVSSAQNRVRLLSSISRIKTRRLRFTFVYVVISSASLCMGEASR